MSDLLFTELRAIREVCPSSRAFACVMAWSAALRAVGIDHASGDRPYFWDRQRFAFIYNRLREEWHKCEEVGL
jgi:hypothetical protein